jgi:hypothetical protein
LPNTFQFWAVAEKEVPSVPTWNDQVIKEAELGANPKTFATRLNKDHEDIEEIL